MFWKKKRTDTSHDGKIILGMIMLSDNNTFDINQFTLDFNKNYGRNIHKPSGDNASFIFKIDDEMLAIAYMNVPIPKSDIEGTAQYAYNWLTALEDTKDHKSHLIVSVMQGGEFKTIDSLVSICLYTYNRSLKSNTDSWRIDLNLFTYWRQIVAVVDKWRNRKVYINYLCNVNRDSEWSTKLLFVEDGGNCYFNVKIDLTSRTYFDFGVNGVG